MLFLGWLIAATALVRSGDGNLEWEEGHNFPRLWFTQLYDFNDWLLMARQSRVVNGSIHLKLCQVSLSWALYFYHCRWLVKLSVLESLWSSLLTWSATLDNDAMARSWGFNALRPKYHTTIAYSKHQSSAIWNWAEDVGLLIVHMIWCNVTQLWCAVVRLQFPVWTGYNGWRDKQLVYFGLGRHVRFLKFSSVC